MNISQTINRAVSMQKAGKTDEAAALYRDILKTDPNNVNALHLLGVCYMQREEYSVALAYLTKSVQLAPEFYEAQSNLGIVLLEVGQNTEALHCYDWLIGLQPRNAVAHKNRGNALRALGQDDAALSSYQLAAQIKPDLVSAYVNGAAVLNNMGRHQEAQRYCVQALTHLPQDAEALYQQARALLGLGQHEDSLAACGKALFKRTGWANVLNLQGVVMCEMGRFLEALSSLDQALIIRPNWIAALLNRTTANIKLNRFEAALADCNDVIHLEPNLAEGYARRGAAQKGLGRSTEALSDFDHALALNSDFAEVYSHKADLLRDLNRCAEACACYERLLELSPDMPLQYGEWLYTKLLYCDWHDYDVACAQVSQAISESKPVSTPLVILGVRSTAADQRSCAEIFVRKYHPKAATQLWQGEIYDHGRIHIGYFSADMHNHATAHLMAEFFERHDKTRFKITAFSFGPLKNDVWRTRLVNAFDDFLDVRDLSDSQIAQQARDREIDIAVDLKGFTKDCRLGIFALRPAPVQINYLGYPGTMGANYIDYIIADPTLIPADSRSGYSEKIIYLPHTYQCNDATKPIAETNWRRADLGLPESSFVFCCFNNARKITPDVFEIWMRLLRNVSGSVLWLYSDRPESEQSLRREAMKRDVDPQRLIFAQPMPLAEHLGRYRYADLFLDTFYWNAHTTASDALWAGLPVLTCLGETFASRVGGSLLRAVGLPELVVNSHLDYECLAVHLATHSEELLQLRARLDSQRLTQPLFNSTLFTHHMEQAYHEVWRRAQSGLPPDDIHINLETVV